MRSKFAYVVMIATPFACGDALVPTGYAGEPVLSITGRITDFRDAQVDERLKASVFWWPDDVLEPDLTRLVEHADVATRVMFPATFEINVFTMPPLDRLDDSKPFQIGTVLIYADDDRDGHFSDGELRGGGISFAIIWANVAMTAEQSPTGDALPVGYSVVRLPLLCGLDISLPPGVEDCGVPMLGEACEGDAQCGQGRCHLGDAVVRFPDGVCVIDAVPGGCEPSNSERFPRFDEVTGEISEMYLPACIAPNECREGYECPLDIGVCVPEEPFFIDLFSNFEPRPFCIDDLGSF